MLAQTPQAGNGGATYFVPGTGAQQTQNVWRYLHADGLGSVRHVTGAAGQAAGQMRYTPFGETAEQSGATSLFGFTGEPQGGLNDLVYLRARYYNPALGRFLTQDSLIPDVSNGQALNPYAYVYNDPINWVDPSGNIPSGRLSAGATEGVRWAAEQGLGALDWWYGQPDSCECSPGTGAPQSVIDTATWLNNKAVASTQLALAAYTEPATTIASRVDVYGKWPVSTRFGRVGVDRYFKSFHNVDVTNLKLTDHTKSYDYINGAGQRVKVLRMSDGRKVTIHNSQTRTTVGPKGLVGSIVGAGLIDAAFQLYGDWASGLCLSRNQKFWRANVALQFGLVAGAVGAAAVVTLVAFGAPALAAGLAGYGVSLVVGEAIRPYKENLIDRVSAAAGR